MNEVPSKNFIKKSFNVDSFLSHFDGDIVTPKIHFLPKIRIK